MSAEGIAVESPRGKLTVGPWLKLWQAQQIIWSLSMIVAELAKYPSDWKAFVDVSPPRLPSDTHAGRIVQVILIAYAVLHLLAALCLIWQRWSAIRTALVLLWLASIEVAAASLIIPPLHPAIRDLFYLPLDVAMVLPLACTAYFLSSPRIAIGYRRPVSRRDADRRLDQASKGRQEPWRLLLIALLVSPLLYEVYQLQLDIAQGLTHIGGPGPGQGWPGFVLSVLNRNIILLLHVLVLLIAAGLLQWRRQWSTIRFVVVLLWLWPLYTLARALIHYAIVVPPFISMSLDGGTWGPYFLIASTAHHLGALLDLGWAIAWAGYLLESSVIDRLYPGNRKRSHLATDMDAF